jgi:DnaJ-domain-containing protein 1
VTNYFTLLSEPLRPWLDPEALKQRFLNLSAEVHPDRVHQATPEEQGAAQARYTELNAAYQCLREPRQRLRHLLELERGAKLDELLQVPQDLMDVFFNVSQLCRQVDAFLAEKANAVSPMLKVQIFEQGLEWTDKLMSMQKEITARLEQLSAEVKAVDRQWIDAKASSRESLLNRLETIARLLGFYERWGSQIQERIVRLSF